MDEIIDQLREKNQPVPIPLVLPNEDNLVIVAEEILLPLPRDLKEFLLTVSDVIYGHLEPVTAADPQSHTYLPEVAAQAWDLGMPRYLIPLCADGNRYYCVSDEGEVLLWDGDLAEESWESVWYWAQDVWLES